MSTQEVPPTLVPVPNTVSTVSPGSATAATSPLPTSAPNNKTKLIVILASCIGGFVLLIVIVLVVVPLSRRYVERRRRHQLSASTAGPTQRGLSHQRVLSGPDASEPLLDAHTDTPDPDTPESHTRFGSPPSAADGETIELYDPWSSNAEAGPSSSRAVRPPPPTLRHTKTRIAHPPMETLPEHSATAPTSPAAPPAPPTPTPAPDPHAATWLHVPSLRGTGVPLIGAFRASVSSLRTAESALPAMQHYPSFTATHTSRSQSPTTFYSASSGEHEPAGEHGELRPRLRGGGGGAALPEVHDAARPVASRHGSLLYGGASTDASSRAALPGAYPTSGSASSASVYSDARSRPLDEEDVAEVGGARPWSPVAAWQAYWKAP